MRVVPVISSALCAVALAGCGGKAAGPAGAQPRAAVGQLPWEAALTVGVRFELVQAVGDDAGAGEPLVVTVTAVEPHSSARLYRLDWSQGNGPRTITVEDGEVTVGDAAFSEMLAPWPEPGTDATCYGADYSNPAGCDDVCEASLCLSPTGGIVGVEGLYAPNYDLYRQRATR